MLMDMFLNRLRQNEKETNWSEIILVSRFLSFRRWNNFGCFMSGGEHTMLNAQIMDECQRFCRTKKNNSSNQNLSLDQGKQCQLFGSCSLRKAMYYRVGLKLYSMSGDGRNQTEKDGKGYGLQ